jgi:hypothetical protein
LSAAKTTPPYIEPHRAGVYVNFLDSDDDTNRVHEAYGYDTYRRLAEVKAKYDPENVFHDNKNIRPATPAQSTPVPIDPAPRRGSAIRAALPR